MKVKELFEDQERIDIESYLNKKGITDVKEFLKPTKKSVEDFNLYDNMDKGYDLIKKYLNKKIYLIVDCDVDGFCSSAIMFKYLKYLNKDADIEIFIHKGKLHGLDDREIVDKMTEPSLIILPDASGEYKVCEELHNKGFKILSIDHHDNEPHEYITMINAHFCKNKELLNNNGSGTATTYQFLRYLDNKLGLSYSKEMLDFVMIGNISDSMSMNNYYNKAYNYYGFKSTKHKFINKMFEEFKVEPNPTSISFNLAPKINAVIRSDENELKYNLFIAMLDILPDYAEDEIIKKCKQCHKTQQKNVSKYKSILLEQCNESDNIILIKNNDLPSSLTGLLANTLMSATNKPVVIVKDDLIGSMRSPIPIKDIFNFSDDCDWCKGHESAAGIKIKNFELFKDYCLSLKLDLDKEKWVLKSFNVGDIPIYLWGYFDSFLDLFGTDLEEPQFEIKDIKINGKDIQEIGKSRTTIKFKIGDISFIKFFCSSDWKKGHHIGEDVEMNLSVIGRLQINEYEGNTNKQVLIDDLEVNLENELNFDNFFIDK